MHSVSLNLLASATHGQIVGSQAGDVSFTRVEIDSRAVRPGDVFWALPGEHHDGHEFLVQARHRGAGTAVVRRDRLAQAQESWKSGSGHGPVSPLIVVEETLTALAELARWYRSQQEGLVIGVTGSFGKTSTREMIHAALSATHLGVRSPKNFNNHIGLPLSLLELDQRHEFAVLEMGASAVGEIAMLAEIARPEVGVITGIGLAHVEGFGSPERIVLGKGELLEALPATGFAILPSDDPLACSMKNRASCPVFFVGESEGDHVQATNVRVANQRLTFDVDHFEYEVPVTGRHFLRAALTALAIAREIGMSPTQIADGLANFQATPGRCQVHQIGPWTVIDDTYNANPASMRAACETLRYWHGANKRLLITGDMRELGPHAEQAHVDLGRTAAKTEVDGLLVFGDHAEHVVRGALEAGLPPSRLAQCDHFEILLTVLDCVLEPGDVLLVKGSRSTRMERVIDWLRAKSGSRVELTALSPQPSAISSFD